MPAYAQRSARPLTTKGNVRGYHLPPLRPPPLHRSITMPDLGHVSDLSSHRSLSQWKSPYTSLSSTPAVPSYPPGSIESPESNKIRVGKTFRFAPPNPQRSEFWPNIEQANMGVSGSRSPSPIPSPIMPPPVFSADMPLLPPRTESFQSNRSVGQIESPISTLQNSHSVTVIEEADINVRIRRSPSPIQSPVMPRELTDVD